MDKPMGGEIEWHTTDQQTHQRTRVSFAIVQSVKSYGTQIAQTQRQGLYTADVGQNFNLKNKEGMRWKQLEYS